MSALKIISVIPKANSNRIRILLKGKDSFSESGGLHCAIGKTAVMTQGCQCSPVRLQYLIRASVC